MGILDGKVAIVTGGTSGIGERIVEVFVEEGAKVVVGARREDEGAALAKRLGVIFARADVAEEKDMAALVATTLAAHGRVDCLVNNAGIPAPMVSIVDVDAETIDRVLKVNVRGVLLGVKHVAPAMLVQGGGAIINIGSVAGHRGGVSAHAYSASKGAVHAFTLSAAAELGEKGIRVNCISPGAIVTGFFAKNAGVEGPKADRLNDGLRAAFAGLQPIPRAGAPDDVARCAAFLASNAASFISGQDILVDGGYAGVAKGWSTTMAARDQMSARLRAAAATS